MKRPFTEVAQVTEEETDGLLMKQRSPKFSHKEYEASTVIADEIKTRTLQIDDEFLGEVFTTNHGDIAYHFRLNDQTQSFEEGEVIGFVQGEKCMKVEKLSLKNCKDVKLKGVVTRSQYLEAQKPAPDDKGKTETICMLGSIPVRVQGSVRAKESLYVSHEYPGVAVGSQKLNNIKDNSLAFIGVAFSCRLTNDESSVGSVQAIVSISESNSHRLANEIFKNLDKEYDQEITREKGKSRRIRKRCIIISISISIFLLLLGILLWQLLLPGTAYRYWKCKQGRKEPHSCASFKFIPYKDINNIYQVNGIEFTYHGMIEKMKYEPNIVQPLKLNNTSVRYYTNVDRCAHGGLRKRSNKALGLKVVRGANVFAVDGDCKTAYYHDDSPPPRWKKYNSAKYLKCFCD